jgi:hypothetical protein
MVKLQGIGIFHMPQALAIVLSKAFSFMMIALFIIQSENAVSLWFEQWVEFSVVKFKFPTVVTVTCIVFWDMT